MPQPPVVVVGDFNAPEPEDENDFGGSEMIEINENEQDEATTQDMSSERMQSQTDSLLGMSSGSNSAADGDDIEMANL